jgi:hypothetical protein
MIKHFFIAALCGLLMSSCTKEENTVKTNQPPTDGKAIKTVAFAPGEDDDPPIIMERIKTADGRALSNVSILLQSRDTTISGSTDENGECLLHLHYYGSWQIELRHEGYQTLNATLSVTQDSTVRNDTMVLK